MNKENKKVLDVVDEALCRYGTDLISVDLYNGMLDVNICTRHSSDVYKKSVASKSKCNLRDLEKELDQRHIGHCW